MTEKTLVNSIMQKLRRRGIYVVKLHGGAYQQPGLPDLWFVIGGKLHACEVKLPKEHGGKDATPLQRRELKKLRTAGAKASVVRSWQDVERLIVGREEVAALEHANRLRITEATR